MSLGQGDAVGLLQAERASLTEPLVDYLCLMVTRAALAPLVNDVESKATRLIPCDNGIIYAVPDSGESSSYVACCLD